MSGSMVAAAVAGAALTVSAPLAAQAQPAAGGPSFRVPCGTAALVTAINAANSGSGATLVLAANCTYNITTPATAADGLPAITGHVILQGGPNTVIRRIPVLPAAFRILDVTAAGTLIVNDVSILNGSTAGFGGGIQNAGTLILEQVRMSGNAAGNGGAVANNAGATATVSDTLMTGNTTTSVGGGGILNLGTLTLTGSIISGNTAPINGGGINTQSAGITRVIQSTVNRNTSGGPGGGLSNLGTTTLVGTTVEFNKGSAGGGIATGNTNVTLRGSTVENNTPDNCSPLNTIPGCIG
jgi:hypothetical protein